MTVPDAAIESAAKVLAFGSHQDADEWWATLPNQDKYRTKARAALEAAESALAQECDNGQANTCRHDSASGMDTSFGPGKVWRCDHCGLCWIEGYSPHDDRGGTP